MEGSGMATQLLTNILVYRTKFVRENYLSSSDILALVKSGSFNFESKDGVFTVGPNECALFRRDVLYHRTVVEPVTMYLFRYQSDEPVFVQDKITFRDTARIQSTLNLLEQIDNGIFKNEFELRTAVLIDIMTQYTIENNAIASTGSSISDPIGIAVARISEALHHKINLAQVAELTGLSYVQFVRRFKAETGMTPSEYVSVLRLQKAKNLLSQTDLSIRYIANACGFENEYYFSNFFKKHMALSPTAFRKDSME
jgi:AraC-like DNA-binding protein